MIFISFIIGEFLGLFIAALCASAGKSDDQNEEFNINDENIEYDIREFEKTSERYINLGDLIDKFIEIDNKNNHQPWNLSEILTNFRTIESIRIDEDK